MKPNFALTFTSDSIGLLHRTARGWLEIGVTPFDAPDLAEALSYLRRSALGLAPHGVATKLVLPDDQILYLTLDAPGPSDTAREAQIRRALEGRTPYDVADLVFDWAGDGHQVQVAVIARETLDEAESFAAEHRFNPIAFVAQPDPARFGGEPWFGPTRLAASLLPEGEVVEREQAPMRVVSRNRAPEVEAPALPVAAPALSEAADPAPSWTAADETPEEAPEEAHEEAWASDWQEPEAVAIAEPDPQPWPEEMAEAIADLPPEPEPEPEPERVPEAVIAAPVAEPEGEPLQAAFDLAPPRPPLAGPEVIPPVTAPPRRYAPPLPETAPEPEPEPVMAPPTDADPILPASALPEIEADEPALNPTLAQTAGPKTADPGLPLPDLLDSSMLAHALAAGVPPLPEAPFIAIDDEPEVASFTAPAADAPAAAGPKVAVTTIINHRRTPAAPLTPPATAASAPAARPYDPALTDGLTGGLPDDLPLDPAAAAFDADPPAAPAPQIQAARAASLGAAPTRHGKASPAPAGATKPAAGKAAASLTAALPGKAKAAAAKIGKPAARSTQAAAGSTLVAPPPPAEAAAPMRGRPPMRRGKPRFLGLILTGLLLLALAAIGAWSSIALSRMNQPALDETELAALSAAEAEADGALTQDAPDAGASAEAEGTLPSVDDEALADGEDLAPASDAALTDQPAMAPAAAPALAQDQGPAAVPLGGDQDEIFLSSMDTPPRATDALTLAAPEVQADALPSPAAPPPPYGTQYEFDEKGMIRPTPEGIVTPEGLRLVAGPPPKVPPPRPDFIAAKAAAPAPAPETNAEANPAQVGADPRLQGFRPRPRPEGLIPPSADDAALDIPADRRMTSLTPRARPANLAKRAEDRARDLAAREAAQAASLSATAVAAAQPGAAAVPQEEDPTAEAVAAAAAAGPRVAPISPQAVTISRKPPKKPRDFDRRVQAAVAAAAAPSRRAQPAPEEPEPSRTARSAEPGEDEEPVAAAAKAPKVPTKASVAKNATFVNAINLSRTNLIGVYGTPSKRYALIRLGNGQYKKVRVGDRVDGGTVAAITESEVRYKKGGRMVSLAMPRG